MTPDFLPGNRIELLETGAQYFPALRAAIAAANSEILLETYIFADDATGREIVTDLAAAARRGVTVRVLADGFGAREFPAGAGRRLAEAGVQIEIYRAEIDPFKMRRHRLRRLHRKLVVIDDQTAFVGGINIIDDLNNGNATHLGPRFDYAVRIEGPLVASVRGSMNHLWRLIGWARLRRRPPLPSPATHRPAAPPGNMAAAFVIRDNLRHRRDIEEVYLDAIAGARTEIFLASAYFLPGRRFRRALRDAAGRGVAVVVMLQGEVEYALLHYATQALYHSLLRSGIRIVEYHAGFLHAKVAVVDDRWATVGSSNIDPFSLLLAREANVIVRDAGFATRLRNSLRQACGQNAVEISRDDIQRSSIFARALRWAAYGMVRLLLGLTRYGGKDYRE